jgi:hypothetical protein
VGRPVLRGAVLLLCYLVGLTYAAKQERRDRLEHHWPLVLPALPLLFAALGFPKTLWLQRWVRGT